MRPTFLPFSIASDAARYEGDGLLMESGIHGAEQSLPPYGEPASRQLLTHLPRHGVPYGSPPVKRDVGCMKMNKTKELVLRLLAVLAFATTTLAAVHSLVFVWLTGFVYRDNIRGYVPAGIGAMTYLGIAMLVLLFYLAVMAKRHRNSAAPYIGIGCLAAPLAILVFSIYTSLVIPFLGKYSWQKDVTMAAVGAIVCIVMSIIFHRMWLSKKSSQPSP